MEASFEMANVKGWKTKYLQLLTNLPPDILESITYAMQPHSDEPYNQLKQAVIRETSLSTEQAIRKFTSKMETTNMKPSKILSNLKLWNLTAKPGVDTNSCSILRYQFLSSLPSNIQHHLVE